MRPVYSEHSAHRVALALVAIVALVSAGGCTTRTVFDQVPYLPAPLEAGSDGAAEESRDQEPPPRPVLALDDVRLFVDESEYTPAGWLVQALVDSIEKAGVFAEVIKPEAAERAPDGSVRAAVRITDRYSGRGPLSYTWFMLSFMTGSLPTMLIPLEQSLDEILAIDFTLPSGEPLTYRIQTAATRKLYLVYSFARGPYADVVRTNLLALRLRLERDPMLRNLSGPAVDAD